MAERESLPRLSITAQQADVIAALARMYMDAETLRIVVQPDTLTGSLTVESREWRWIISERGRIAAEGKIEEPSDAF